MYRVSQKIQIFRHYFFQWLGISRRNLTRNMKKMYEVYKIIRLLIISELLNVMA